MPKRHLIIFDEVQASDRALTSLKYFHELAGDHHVAAAGSLLGIKMSRQGSFPVGKVNFLDLRPMSFLEFLRAMGKPRYAELLLELAEPKPLPDAIHLDLIHLDLIDLLPMYYFAGGMPEAVSSQAETGDARITRQITIARSRAVVIAWAAPPRRSDRPH